MPKLCDPFPINISLQIDLELATHRATRSVRQLKELHKLEQQINGDMRLGCLKKRDRQRRPKPNQRRLRAHNWWKHYTVPRLP